MRAPFMCEETCVGINIFEGRGIGRAGSSGAILGIATVVVLRPEPVQNKGEMRCALGCILMGVTELRRPGEVKQVIVET